MSTDMELLQEYAECHSEDAFAELVRRHVSLVYSVALRQLRDPHMAEETTQAVFIVLARKAAALGPGTILPGWLCRTARYASADALKAQMRRRRREREALMHSDLNDPQPESWSLLAPLVERALGQLGAKDHDAIVLRFFESRDFKQIGAALGGGEAAAKMRVSRALEKLRKFFARRGVALPVAAIAGAVSANAVQAAPPALAAAATAAALGKGAAGAAPALLIMKGTLKLMTLAKVKTAAAVGATALFTAGTAIYATTALHAVRAAHYPDIQGAWQGILEIGEGGVQEGEKTQTRVVLKIARTSNGYAATADAIDLGRKDIPIHKLVYEYPKVRVELNRWSSAQGTLDREAREMKFEENGAVVVLKRTATPDSVPERLSASEYAPRSNSALQGYWKGTLGMGPDALPLSWKIAELRGGELRAELDNPMQGANGQPVSVVWEPPRVKLMTRSGSGMFEGRLEAGNTQLAGLWVQRGEPTPSTFKRADPKAEPPQPAEADYAWDSKADLQGHWRGTLDLKMTRLRAVLDIAKLADGSYCASLASPDEYGNDDPVPVADVRYSPPKLRLEWKWWGGVFEGKLKNGTLTGTWRKNGRTLPLVLERSGKR